MRNLITFGLISRARFAFVFVWAALIAGCGGGGGGGGGGSPAAAGCLPYQSGCTSTSGSSGGGTTTTGVSNATLSLFDATNPSVEKNTLTSGKPLLVKVVVTNASGAVVPNAVVTFATDAAFGTFDPPSGTSLTDASGIAKVTLLASSLTSNGAANVTASTTVDTATVTSRPVGYAVTPGTIELRNLAANSTSLGAYGSTSVTVDVYLNGQPAASAQTVSFASSCASQATPKAVISTSAASVNGTASATYTDAGCAATDTITASMQGAAPLTTSIVVAAPTASNISYVSASPASIVLAGTGGGGLSSDSVVTFKVVDSTNSPIASKVVNFDLSTRVGGIKLNNQASGTVQGTSNASGLVSVTVSAGSVPTPVWVTASLDSDPSIKTQSTNLTISTGRPTQDRFSFSIKTFNIEGWRRDGTQTDATVYAADRLGNPVADGTVVNFISEGAIVQPSCQTTSGSCSVKVTSGEIRPRVDTEPSSFGVTAGRVTLLAYAQGEESFDDLNTNNVYDSGEPFRDLGDAFVDSNENSVWASGEREIEFNRANASSCMAYPSDGRYYNAPYKAGTCNGAWGTAHVRRTAVVVLSSYVIGTVSPSAFTSTGCVASYTFRLSDENNNPMPAGAALGAVSSVTYRNDAFETVKASVSFALGSATVPNTSAPGGSYHTIIVEGSKCTSLPVGSIGVTVTSPSGDASSRTITIN